MHRAYIYVHCLFKPLNNISGLIAEQAVLVPEYDPRLLTSAVRLLMVSMLLSMVLKKMYIVHVHNYKRTEKWFTYFGMH